jgi:hypothetical protein
MYSNVVKKAPVKTAEQLRVGLRHPFLWLTRFEFYVPPFEPLACRFSWEIHLALRNQPQNGSNPNTNVHSLMWQPSRKYY